MNLVIPTALFLSAILAGTFIGTGEAKNDCFPDRFSCYASNCKKCQEEPRPKSPNCLWKCKDSSAVVKLAKGIIAAIVIGCLIFIALIVCLCMCVCCPFCYCAKKLKERQNLDEVDQTVVIITDPAPTPQNYGTSEPQAPPPYPGPMESTGYPYDAKLPPSAPEDSSAGGIYPSANQ